MEEDEALGGYQSFKIFTQNPDEKFSAKKLIEFFNEIHENEKKFIDAFSAKENQDFLADDDSDNEEKETDNSESETESKENVFDAEQSDTESEENVDTVEEESETTQSKDKQTVLETEHPSTQGEEGNEPNMTENFSKKNEIKSNKERKNVKENLQHDRKDPERETSNTERKETKKSKNIKQVKKQTRKAIVDKEKDEPIFEPPDWFAIFGSFIQIENFDEVDQVLTEMETGKKDLTSGLNQILMLGIAGRDFGTMASEIVNIVAEAVGKRSTKYDGAAVSCHFALSEAIQHTFHIALGAGSMDFNGLRLAQIACVLDDINDKIDIILQTPLKSAIKHFKTTLNILKHGEMKNSLEELREAKTKANDALSIFEMRSIRSTEFESVVRCVQILSFAILLISSCSQDSGKIRPYQSLNERTKKLIAIEHIAILDSLLLIQSNYHPSKFTFRKSLKLDNIQCMTDQMLMSLYPFLSMGMGWTPGTLGVKIKDSFKFRIVPKYLPSGCTNEKQQNVAEIILGIIHKSKKRFSGSPYLHRILSNGGQLSVKLWRTEMKGGANRSEKTQIVAGHFFLGDEATGLKFFRKIQHLKEEIEIELKSDCVDPECEIVYYGCVSQEGEGFLNAQGQMCGRGILESRNGSRYLGQFKNNRKHGFGIHFYEILNVRERFVGYWEGGLMKGHGTLIYKDGRKHVGNFDSSGIHGYGTLYSKDGSVCATGTWQSSFMVKYGGFSFLIEDVRNTNTYFEMDLGKCGTLMFADGKQYSGGLLVPFLNPFGPPRCFHGQGTLISEDGTVIHKGRWEVGQFQGNGSSASKKLPRKKADQKTIPRSKSDSRCDIRNLKTYC